MFGLDDRLWVGYWIGGASSWLCALAVTVGDLPIWLAFIVWLALTPTGIFIAKQQK